MRSGRRAQVGNASNWFSAAAAAAARTGQTGRRTAWHATSSNNNQRVAPLRQSFCCCRFSPPVPPLLLDAINEATMEYHVETDDKRSGDSTAGGRGKGQVSALVNDSTPTGATLAMEQIRYSRSTRKETHTREDAAADDDGRHINQCATPLAPRQPLASPSLSRIRLWEKWRCIIYMTRLKACFNLF